MTHLWSLREDVHLEVAPDQESVTLHSRWGQVTVRTAGPTVCEVLRRMRLGPVLLDNALTDPDHSRAEYIRLRRLLDRLQFLVIRSLAVDGGRPLLSVVPLTAKASFRPRPLEPDRPIRLSRFATLRSDGHDYVLESPLSLHRVMLHRPEALHLIAELGRPAMVAPDAETGEALSFLASAGMVVQAGTDGFAEDNDPALVTWSPLDLMFHTRSTLGRHDDDFGATYPQGEESHPEPVVKPRLSGARIGLPRPSWAELAAADPSLTAAIEGRRSIRDYGPEPLTLAELGELLYRAARVRSVSTQTSDRPYPSGGASYEVEIYVTVRECVGVRSGIYHYDPLDHALELVCAEKGPLDDLLQSARTAANLSGPPSALLSLTVRFRRLSWKYSGLSYALALKDAGVLMQTLYLVCAAMGLAACAVGSENIDATAEAFGVDWRVESSVGAFLVGRHPHAEATPSQARQVNDSDWAQRARAILDGHGEPRGGEL